MRKHLLATAGIVVLIVACSILFRWIASSGTRPENPAHKPTSKLDASEGKAESRNSLDTDSAGVHLTSALTTREARKRWIASRLLSKEVKDILHDASTGHVEPLHLILFGDNPSFRELVKEFQTRLGSDFSGTVLELYEELHSPAMRSVLLLALGSAHKQEAMAAMKDVLAEGQNHVVMAASAYAIGLLGTDEALSFLTSYERLLSVDSAPSSDNVRTCVHAAIATQGEKVVPVLMELSRRQLSDIPLHSEPDEYLYIEYSDRWLSHLRLGDVSPSFRQMIRDEPDPRLRFTMLVALTENKKPENYEFLAELYNESSDKELRREVLAALRITCFRKGESASQTDNEIRTVLRGLLESTRPGGEDPYVMDKMTALAVRMGDAASVEWIEQIARRALDDENDPSLDMVRDHLPYYLARLPDGRRHIHELAERASSRDARLEILLRGYQGHHLRLDDREVVQEFTGALAKAEPRRRLFERLIRTLGRAEVDREAVLKAFSSAYDTASLSIRHRLLEASGALGNDSRPFFDAVLNGNDGPLLRAQAARQLIKISSAENVETRERVRVALAPLLTPTNEISTEIFQSARYGHGAHAALIRDYYKKYGTEADLGLLEAVPERLVFDRTATPKLWAKSYRARIVAACNEARDVIMLRTLAQ